MTRMKTLSLLAASVLATAGTTNAAVVTVHQYDLGETGTIIGGVAQATVGSHFTNNTFAGSLAVGTGTASPVSSAYATDTSVLGGNWGANFSAFATDNFGVEIWVRTSDVAQGGDLFGSAGNNAGSLKLSFVNGGWAASYASVGWIGDNANAGGNSQTATADEWTHLAVIRDDGVSTFYINGVAQAGTVASAPTHGTGHLGLSTTASGGSGFVGDYDALRLFTFGAEDDPVAALNVPEPGSLALLGFGGLCMLRRRRA